MQDSLRLAALSLKRAQIAKSGAFDRNLASLGLTMAQWVVLDRIRAHPAQSTHALAKASLMTDQSVGELVAKLAKRGLIQRVAGPGRSIRHHLTDAGAELLEKAAPLVADALESAFAGLSHSEIEQLIQLLDRIATTKMEV
ncbi:MarR family transcriptional regulator [Methylocystis sp. MJC1]|jgi:DNA-binding MarR family transcriptional regulator|uniref:MarR family winged helix-turn-helix transcriptional regulator n=1 Tax=Methylocystis sp. MJC1 TaxID=2654282 RepID=UPI0013ED3ACA|nr:MarR family transcriptional regulator [Methylocystis sp. MJC1]KAF2992072.1 Transcriptional regulator SlyA [Methylocystis sp. MJC1]MBU6525560.1 MarR family transcriptional regulator [Methylocystis sp. MJC1]UZX12040.1 MarR family transcriptional regulator [Methylocystis sp. MJC1]